MTPDMLLDIGSNAGLVFLFGAPSWLVLSYFFLVWDARQPQSATASDGQIGIKLVGMFLLLIGLGIAAGGLASLLHYLLSGAKGGKEVL
jgi:hypothetical protein